MFKTHSVKTSGIPYPLALFDGDDGGHISDVDPRYRGASTTSAGGTLANQPGDPIGLIERQAGSFNFTQSTSGLRGTLGRFPSSQIRNRLLYSTLFSNAAWAKNELTCVDNTTLVPSTNSSAVHRTQQGSIPFAGGQTITISGKLQASGYSFPLIRISNTGEGIAFQVQFNLTTGALASAANAYGAGASVVGATITPASDAGWYDFTLTGAITSVTSYVCSVYVYAAAGASAFAGDGTSGIKAEDFQMEAAATASAYQNAVTADNITQPGIPDLYLPYFNGSQWMTASTGTFGTASLFCDAGQQWCVWGVFRTVLTSAAQVLLAKSGVDDLTSTFQVVVRGAGGGSTISCFARGGTQTNFSAGSVADGAFQVWAIRWDGTTLTGFCNLEAGVTLNVGAAAEETQNITLSCRTQSSPTRITTGHNAAAMVDHALSDAQMTQLMAALNSTYRRGL